MGLYIFTHTHTHTHTHTLYTARRPRARAVGAAVAAEGKQRPASPATTAAGAAGVTGGATAGAGTAGAELRPRVLHLLAIKPHTRTDLEQRLKIAQGDPALTALLNEVHSLVWFPSAEASTAAHPTAARMCIWMLMTASSHPRPPVRK